MWKTLARGAGLTPGLERRVSNLETWRNVHESAVRDKNFALESDVNALIAAVTDLREELHADRATRLELGTLNTEAILAGFQESSEGIVTRVMDSVWAKLALAQADLTAIKTRMRTLEMRGTDE